MVLTPVTRRLAGFTCWIYGFVHELKHMTGMQFGAVPLAGHAKPP